MNLDFRTVSVRFSLRPTARSSRLTSSKKSAPALREQPGAWQQEARS